MLAVRPDGSTYPAFIGRVFAAVNDGWSLGFLVGAAFLALSAFVMGSLVRIGKEEAAAALKEGGAVHAG